MSMETQAFQDELDLIKKDQELMEKSVKELTDFIIGDEFLEKPRDFEKKRIDTQSKLITLAQEVPPQISPQVQSPVGINPMQGQMPPNGMPAGQTTLMNMPGNTVVSEAAHFSWAKTAVAIAGMVASGVLVAIRNPVYSKVTGRLVGYQSMLPVSWFIAILGCCLGMVFFDSIWKALSGWLMTNEKRPLPKGGDDWIGDAFTKMQNRYTSVIQLIKVQTESESTSPTANKEFVSRKNFHEETMRGDFLNEIGEISQSCSKNVWARRRELAHLISQTRASGMGIH
jgi:hypothetical protein